MNRYEQERIIGAVLFVDLDNYLDAVKSMGATEEWHYLRSYYEMAAKSAANSGCKMVRTFGDGLLLYAEGDPDTDLLQRCASFLRNLHTALRKTGVSFKAAVVGGEISRITSSGANGEIEVLLAGPIANYAGKQIQRLGKGKLFCAWPFDAADNKVSYADLEAGNSNYRMCTLELINITKLIPSLKNSGLSPTSASSNIGSEKPETLEFSNEVKSLTVDMIKLADDKAKAAFALSTALVVYLFNGQEYFPSLDSAVEILKAITFFGALCGLGISAYYSMRVLMPRMRTNYDGLVFFDSVAAKASGKEYADAVMSASKEDLQRETAIHNYELAKVTAEKFDSLKKCLRFLCWGVLAAVIFILVMWHW